jgi:hypothetical protein
MSFPNMNILVRCVLAVSAALLAMALSAPWTSEPAMAASAIQLSPSSGTPGTTVEVTGSGFTPYNVVDIRWDGTFITETHATPNGDIRVPFNVPTNAALGDHTVSTSGLPPPTAHFTVVKDSSCRDVLFLGVHGTGEGPPDPRHSAVIETTWTAFYGALPAGVSKAVDYVQYPADLQLPSYLRFAAKVNNSEDQGVKALDHTFFDWLSRCPAQKFVMAGYSMGAWVIDDWFASHHLSAQRIFQHLLAVVNYGDPMFLIEKSKPPVEGITRIVGGFVKVPMIPDRGDWGGSGFVMRSICAYRDPICGVAYDTYIHQRLATLTCAIDSGCSHYSYADKGATLTNGRWLAAQYH